MNAVVAGGVVPAAMDIHSAVAIRQRKMPIGAIHIPAGPLSLEIEQDIRQRCSLQQIVFNLKAAGTGGGASSFNAQDIVSRRMECRKVRLPIRLVVPMVYAPGWRRRAAEYHFSAGIVDQRELPWMFVVTDGDQRNLWRGGLVAHLIHQDTHLRGCQRDG